MVYNIIKNKLREKNSSLFHKIFKILNGLINCISKGDIMSTKNLSNLIRFDFNDAFSPIRVLLNSSVIQIKPLYNK